MIKINNTPMRTTQNYQINNISIEEKYFRHFSNSAGTLNVQKTDNVIVTNYADANITKGLGEPFNAQLGSEINHRLTLCVEKNQTAEARVIIDGAKAGEIIDAQNILLQEGSNSKILISCFAKSGVYRNGYIKIIAQSGATADIIIYNDFFKDSDNFYTVELFCMENSKINIIFVDASANNNICSFYAQMLGDNANLQVKTLYLGEEKNTIDINQLVEIFGKNCVVDMDAIGAINGETRKHYKGTIDFKKGCKKSVGKENEYCLLLSKTAKAKSLPMLLCTEEDVDGAHSSAVGKIDDKQLFYIMTRGLDEIEAKRLIIKAQFNNMLSNLWLPELAENVLQKIDGSIK